MRTFLTILETAKFFKRNPITVRRLIESGRLPAERYGWEFLIKLDDIREFLENGGFRPAGRPKKKPAPLRAAEVRA
jgi:excisionase family DNA binding protein